MRPGQNKRMRGRNNNNNNNSGSNNRKGPNPLTRSYESNGPDVKIRGTAHHVAEKYLQLARDAQSSGDPVAAESYLQHAEHYFRLIASAQQAQMGYTRQPEESESEDGDDDDVAAMPDRFASPVERAPVYTAPASQPYQERQPYQGDRQPYNGERPAYNGDRAPAQDRGTGIERNGQERSSQEGRGGPDRGNYERPNRGDRPPRPQRPYRDQDSQTRQDGRGQDFRNREPRGPDYQGHDGRDPAREGGRGDPVNREPVAPREVNGRADQAPREPVVVEREPEPMRQPEAARAPDAALPAFITAPVRLTPPASATSDVVDAAPQGESPGLPEEAAEGTPRFPVRRRRRTRAAIAADLAEAAARAADAPTGND